MEEDEDEDEEEEEEEEEEDAEDEEGALRLDREQSFQRNSPCAFGMVSVLSKLLSDFVEPNQEITFDTQLGLTNTTEDVRTSLVPFVFHWLRAWPSQERTTWVMSADHV